MATAKISPREITKNKFKQTLVSAKIIPYKVYTVYPLIRVAL